MSYLLFVDESGQDLRSCPYEVLAGVAVEDRDLWNLISALQRAEVDYFGRRYSSSGRELKGKKILKRKVFRQATQLDPIEPERRRELARNCLEMGDSAGLHEITALAQAKIEFVRELFLICANFRCKAFASITDRDALRPEGDFLRKDYAYLFERFYYYLEDVGTEPLGLVVFDELERSRSHLLIDQMSRYFRETERGRVRAGRIIPEPFFVHSELTTAVQVADLLAYVIAWGVRVGEAHKPARGELAEAAQLVCDLRYRAVREVDNNPNFVIWSFAVIGDLRPRGERFAP